MRKRTAEQRVFIRLASGTLSAGVAGFLILFLVGGPPPFAVYAGIGLGLASVIGLLMFAGVRLMFAYVDRFKKRLNSVFVLGFFLGAVAALVYFFTETLMATTKNLSIGQNLVQAMLGLATFNGLVWELLVLVKAIRDRTQAG